jgi:F0F1-type ATP synthase membrane subunit c/vacuolar-type H+-ATPase subunit K
MNKDWTPYVAIATSILRHAITALGSFGFTWAQTVSGDQIQMIVSAVAVVGSIVWGIVQKNSAQKAINIATELPAISPPPKLPA